MLLNSKRHFDRRGVRELSGKISVGLKFLLVNIPLCERLAGQSMDKSYLPLPQGVSSHFLIEIFLAPPPMVYISQVFVLLEGVLMLMTTTTETYL